MKHDFIARRLWILAVIMGGAYWFGAIASSGLALITRGVIEYNKAQIALCQD